jgi:hypothetical protein
MVTRTRPSVTCICAVHRLSVKQKVGMCCRTAAEVPSNSLFTQNQSVGVGLFQAGGPLKGWAQRS